MRTSRTDKVLNLLNAEKKEQAVPPEEKPVNPALKIPEPDQVPTVYTRTGSGTQVINVMFLLLNEQLGQVMERFHCCTCAACAQAVTAETLRKLPAVIVTVKRKDDERQVNLLADKYRSRVTQVAAKAVIGVKSNPPHGRSADDQKYRL